MGRRRGYVPGMTDPATHAKGKRGFSHFRAAFGYSLAGFRHALRHEASVRQELLAFLVLVPVAVLLPVEALARLVLVLSMGLVLVVELLNSSIEAAVDRISLERHPLAGRAKDLGSAAVFTAIGLSALCWLVIAGPVVLRWLSAMR
jgi:diacylglycerol kinase (ATP)